MSFRTDPHSGLGFSRRRVGQWNAFSIIRDAVKLSFRSPLPSIQFSLVLPYTIFVYCMYFHYSNVSISSDGNVSQLYQPDQVQASSVSSLLRALFLQITLSLISSSVVTGAVLYAAGSIYQGKNLTFFEIIKLVPRLWRRLFVTTLVYLMPVLLISSLIGVTSGVLMSFISSPNPPFPVILAILALSVVSMVILFIVAITYSVANCVVCFEEEYGVAAFTRARKVLHSKWGSAVCLFILLTVAEILLTTVGSSAYGFEGSLFNGFEWKWVLRTSLYAIFRSYIVGFEYISWGLFYFSCMADSVEDSNQSLKESADSRD
ncbi:hypothetical protein R1flu_015121 [Riccia fluitans]|uniref:Uncharacterized protein n=1 Tax=Riccia fluitans TaxID=41844 RepID=A0ABD1XDU5_9MARC